MLLSEDEVLSGLLGPDDAARAAVLEELFRDGQPITGRVREAVEAIRRQHAGAAAGERAAILIAVADAQSASSPVRRAAVAALLPAQLAAVLACPSAAARKAVLEALITRDAAPFGALLVQHLDQESDPAVLVAAVELVGRSRDRQLMPHLDPLIDRPETAVALAALEAFVALAGDERGPAMIIRLERLSGSHPSSDVRFLARRSVAENRAGAPPAGAAPERGPTADELARALAVEKDVRVLARLVSQLKELGGPEHTEAVRPLLKHPDDRVCANAIETLVALAGAVAVDSLLPLLARDDNRVKANLTLALRERYGVQVEGYVRRMLRAERFSFRISALYCARFLDREEMFPDVVRMVREERNADALRDGLAWLAEYGSPPRAAQALVDLAASRPDAAAPIAEAQARLVARAPEVAELTLAPADPAAGRAAPGPAGPSPAALSPGAATPAAATPSASSSRIATPTGGVPAGAAPGGGRVIPRTRPYDGLGGDAPLRPRSGPISRPGTRPERDPASPARRPLDPRVLLGLAGIVLLAVVAVVLVVPRRDDAPAHAPPSPASPKAPRDMLHGVVTRSTPGDAGTQLQVEARTHVIDSTWPASAGAAPQVGDPVWVGTLHVTRQADGTYHTAADHVKRAPEP